MRLVASAVAVGVVLVATAAQAATQGSADVLSTPGSVDAFNHTVTLHNTGDTPISTFWYSWNLADLNFMPSSPDAITMPTGWSAEVTVCSNGYFVPSYGIEWYTTTDPIPAGQTSSAFGFESNDSADDLQGLSFNNYSNIGYAISTSFVFMNAPDNPGAIPAGPNFQFLADTAAPVPEPASLGILGLALAAPVLRRPRAPRIKR